MMVLDEPLCELACHSSSQRYHNPFTRLRTEEDEDDEKEKDNEKMRILIINDSISIFFFHIIVQPTINLDGVSIIAITYII